MAMYLTNPYSGTTLNGSSVSLAHSIASSQDQPAQASSTSLAQHTSSEHLHAAYKSATENPNLYKPVRPPRSRLRPALPASFLQLPGASSATNTPWRRRGEAVPAPTTPPCKSLPPTPISKDSHQQILLRELAGAIQITSSNNPSSPGSGLSVPHNNEKESDMNRFTSCFGANSAGSLVDPAMMQAVAPVTIEKRPASRNGLHTSVYTTEKLRQPAQISTLQPWRTPTSDHAPTRRISCDALSSMQGSFRETSISRSASRCSLARPGSALSTHNSHIVESDDILHIRLPHNYTKNSNANNTVSSQSSKRKANVLKAEVRELKAAKVEELNLGIRLEDPKAQNAATAIDGLFGVGKEDSKARRCGYGGLGIAYDKKTWNATQDYETLLQDNVRSSLYNISLRSPRTVSRSKASSRASSAGSTPQMSRTSSSTSSTGHSDLYSREGEVPAKRVRKGPPPPLDLSSLSAFSSPRPVQRAVRKPGGPTKEQPRTAKTRANPLESEIDSRVQIEGARVARKVTLKGILRSVRSLTALRGNV